MTRTKLITFDGTGLRYGAHDIPQNISFDVEEGEFVCVIGPSGCGTPFFKQADRIPNRCLDRRPRRGGPNRVSASASSALTSRE
jgi:ABC-type phosphate transport system ATPase subunit